MALFYVCVAFTEYAFSAHLYVQSGCAHWVHGNHASYDCFHGRSKGFKATSPVIDDADIFDTVYLWCMLSVRGLEMST